MFRSAFGRRCVNSRLRARDAASIGLSGLSAAVAALLGCGTVGPEAKPPKKHDGVELGMSCEPSLVYECEELCGNGDVGACEQAGAAYFDGKYADRNPERAWTLSEMACNAGRKVACGVLGKLGQDGARESSDEQIAKNLEKGCEGEDAESCQRFAQLLLSGEGVAKNPCVARRPRVRGAVR